MFHADPPAQEARLERGRRCARSISSDTPSPAGTIRRSRTTTGRWRHAAGGPRSASPSTFSPLGPSRSRPLLDGRARPRDARAGAARARQPEVRFEAALYAAACDGLLARLRLVPDVDAVGDADRAQPGLHELFRRCSRRPATTSNGSGRLPDGRARDARRRDELEPAAGRTTRRSRRTWSRGQLPLSPGRGSGRRTSRRRPTPSPRQYGAAFASNVGASCACSASGYVTLPGSPSET